MTNRLHTLLIRVKDIYREEGLSATIKRIFAIVISLTSFETRIYYVYVLTLKVSNEADYLPEIQNVNHMMIETV